MTFSSGGVPAILCRKHDFVVSDHVLQWGTSSRVITSPKVRERVQSEPNEELSTKQCVSRHGMDAEIKQKVKSCQLCLDNLMHPPKHHCTIGNGLNVPASSRVYVP